MKGLIDQARWGRERDFGYGDKQILTQREVGTVPYIRYEGDCGFLNHFNLFSEIGHEF